MVSCDARFETGRNTEYAYADQIELTQTRVDLETNGRHAMAHDQDWRMSTRISP